ncbi:MAG: FtsX-like permease family protein, partial [Vicinamibacterales bacterium]
LEPTAAIRELPANEEYKKEATAGQRVASEIRAVLALLGVSLLAFGCASLYVSLVRDSAREIAIRMALGADAARLFRRMLAHGLCLGVLGGLLGLVGGWLVARQIADQLYETSTTEPAVLMGAPGLVAVIVLVALAVPAAAAVRRNPLQHLRRE